jgi:flagellar basal-body rod modification protein FlgD
MSQISGATGIDAALTSNQANRFSEMGSEDFLKIIFTELTNQDPLAPNDTGALLDQLNSIRSIESDLELTNQLKALVTENQLASAGNMLGKLVTGRTEDLNRTTGIVVAALKQGDSIGLELDTGEIIPLSGLESVIDPLMFLEPEAPPVDDGDASDEENGEESGEEEGG